MAATVRPERRGWNTRTGLNVQDIPLEKWQEATKLIQKYLAKVVEEYPTDLGGITPYDDHDPWFHQKGKKHPVDRWERNLGPYAVAFNGRDSYTRADDFTLLETPAAYGGRYFRSQIATRMRDYDRHVSACLILMKYVLGDNIRIVASRNDWRCWREGYKLAADFMGWEYTEKKGKLKPLMNTFLGTGNVEIVPSTTLEQRKAVAAVGGLIGRI